MVSTIQTIIVEEADQRTDEAVDNEGAGKKGRGGVNGTKLSKCEKSKRLYSWLMPNEFSSYIFIASKRNIVVHERQSCQQQKV